MKRILTATCLCVSLLVIGANGQRSDGPLTNASIIKLVKAGFKEKTVIAIIGSQPTDFKLDTEQLINLKRNGVNEDIILAMLSAQLGTVVVSEDEWSGDQFFKKSNDADSQGSGTSIFGSGSSSRSSSRSRGGLGGNENEANLSGSATVRIIKPPVEGGENAPRLEKTPTLTNEGVVRLVEAGFSEGTIIKRIEESPVDFDLSPAKVVELQKRRVSEAIIAAMNAAMGK